MEGGVAKAAAVSQDIEDDPLEWFLAQNLYIILAVSRVIEEDLIQKILLVAIRLGDGNIGLAVDTHCRVNFALALHVASNHVMSFR